MVHHKIVHTYPLLDREHLTEGGGGCWCMPTVYRLCPECADAAERGCWRCAGSPHEGLLRIEGEPEDGDESLVIVHNIRGG